MDTLLLNIATVFWPELKEMPLARQLVGVGDVFASLYSGLVSLIGIIWLTRVTDWALISSEWRIFLLLGALILVFSRLNFFMIIEFREDRYGSADGAFNSMMLWAAAFLFGPTAIWLIIVIQLGQFIFLMPTYTNKASLWNNIRHLCLSMAGFTVPYLLGLTAYEALGGTYPISYLDIRVMLISFLAITINFLIFVIIWVPYFGHALHTQKKVSSRAEVRPLFTFFFLALSLPTLAHPFAILAAGLYVENGLAVFLFFVVGLLVVAYLARQFSWMAESNRQQSRQLKKLEQLGRALLNAPPDGSTLSDILAEHIPNMFPSGSIAIWLIPGQTLYKAPSDWEINFKTIWDYVSGIDEAQAFLADSSLPWENQATYHRPVIIAPIIAHEGTEVIGGVYLELRRLSQPWDTQALERLFPGVQALADQISSTVYQAEEYAQSLALEKVGQELQIAGQIQASFLPNEFPNIPGYQLAVTLEPAGGLSGDFFDFIPLSRGRLGIVIADVADKGLGAALYMALCRTLLRTYAFEYHSRPDIVLSETNERILGDARANLFITAFYGVLDPSTNTLTYCNAGHNPPYLIGKERETPIALTRTGMPIGIEEDTRWSRKVVNLKPGDSLILYTDGVTDAQNEAQEFFDDDYLLRAALEAVNGTAFEIQANILGSIRKFMGDAPQFDDITLMILSMEDATDQAEPNIPHTPATENQSEE